MRSRTSFLGFLGRIEGLPVAAVLVALLIVFILSAPTVFLGPTIYAAFLQTIPPELVLALGLTLVITAGDIDLSFPAIVALSGFLFATGTKLDPTWGPWVGILLALAGGVLAGYVNGLLVARVGVPSIMATLAAQFFWYGVTILLAGGLQLNLRFDTHIVHTILSGRIGWIPIEAVWSLLLVILMWFILNRHKFGEEITFIGDNANVARVMGINVELTRIKLFTLMGAMAAFAGRLLTSEIGVFYPTQGQGFMLPVMAGVFIGGTSMAGGSGVVFGTLFGMYIIGILEAGVVATGIGGYWVQLVEGVVMAASVTLNIVIGEGHIPAVMNRIRHWSTPARSNVPVGNPDSRVP